MAVQDNDSTKDLGSLLHAVFEQKKWHNRIGLHQVFLFWDSIVGKEIALRSQPEVIRGDILWVNVSDSVWMQQLQFEKHILVNKINAKLVSIHEKSENITAIESVPQLKDLKFKLLPDLATRAQPALANQNKNKQYIDSTKLQTFEASLSSLEDDNLKKSLTKLWLAVERRKK